MAPQLRGVFPGYYRQALSTLFSHIQGHKNFTAGRTIRTWSLWNGDGEQTSQPTEESAPWCSIRIVGGEIERYQGVGRARQAPAFDLLSKLNLLVELAIPGSNQFLFLDVAEMFRTCLWPSKTLNGGEQELLDLYCRFRGAGIQDWKLIREILPESVGDYSGNLITGRGIVELSLFLPG